MSVVDLQFEWDENKAQKNLRNHKVDFMTAIKVFNDPERIEFYDERHSVEEDRYAVLGMADDILFVVYTQRVNRIRIISARMATRTEEEVYWNGYCNY